MKVLITGGAGFLGRGILRAINRGDLDWEPTIYSRDEEKQARCAKRWPHARYVLGNVQDTEHLAAVMAGHDMVVHAAAVKYIDKAELNAKECVAVNVEGSRSVMAAASRAHIRKVIGISTDKAVQPVNVYGASKMVMERLFADTAQYGHHAPTFICVRYGNVIGSTGSVIPLFQSQYEELGKVKVTNESMTRFWMGIDDAVCLISQAAAYASPGSIAIPYAQAMKLVEVAKAATKDDVDIELIGERPGEKIHETLVHYEESVRVLHRQDAEEPFLELLPPGTKGGKEAFTLASHSPHIWMERAVMRELIEDAKEI